MADSAATRAALRSLEERRGRYRIGSTGALDVFQLVLRAFDGGFVMDEETRAHLALATVEYDSDDEAVSTDRVLDMISAQCGVTWWVDADGVLRVGMPDE